ncbi:MAG: hypothetical protein Q4D76_00780 [Oscillospiraceae bacterium]|nr:hypothetical protein [Oscillospiraceae bacterium]
MSRFKTYFGNLSKVRKIQIGVALLLTISLLVGIPTYAWFTFQREMARFERIASPDTLCITAAHKESTINMKLDGIDVNGEWKNDNGTSVEEKVSYKDYVFSVAGEYVTTFTLQLAHTTNNKFRYEIFEADVTDQKPDGIKEKDYVKYIVTNDYQTDLIAGITDSPLFENLKTGDSLYYSIRKDSGNNLISLNAKDASTTPITKSSYIVGGNTVEYNGHYLNMVSDFKSDGSLLSKSYDNYSNVNEHADALYWQATGIPGGDAKSRASFYHEYILRISWSTSGDDKATNDFKDTDIIYITAKAD